MGAPMRPSTRPRVALLGGDGGRSGVPRSIEALARALSPVAEVAVVSDRDQGGYAFAREAGLRHVEVEGLASSLDPLAVARAGRRLDAALRELAPDVVWSHARLTLPLARALAARHRARLVATYHGLPFGPGHGRAGSALGRAVEEAGLRLAPPHHLVFLSEEDRAAFPGRLLRRHRAHVLGNCSDLGGFAPRSSRQGPPVLAMLTRDARQKDLEAAALLLARLPGAELRLFGAGTDGAGLRARFAAMLPPGALARVTFGGPVADVREVLRGADLLLVTSRYEGLSISMIEAMEYGLPVASTPVGGTALLARAHPLFARIAPREDPEGAARAVERLVAAFRADPARQGAAIHAAWARSFAPAPWAEAARALLAEVLA